MHCQLGGLQSLLSDCCIEIDSNAVEILIPPLALTRKNTLFAGHDLGGRTWPRNAALIVSAKINGIEPFVFLKATLDAVATGQPASNIDGQLPWNFNPSS